ncbi:MFS transporter [Glycomyces arizonensis]|uniref:MFS transporter n=1 Tax=Glycomyces arizonensis TaxID=256035 RepID=UPI0006861824|nr:MFS transporter [Glycomyces arizonensis]
MSPSPPRAEPEAAHPSSRHPALIVLVLGFSSLCAALMQSLVIPIQSELPKLLDTSASNTSWIVTATLLGGAVAMPTAGRLADIFGKKPILIVSAAILVLGSLLCAVGGGFALVLVGRFLQGIAMGYVPVAISMVHEVTPPKMVNTATAGISATLGVGGALGLPIAAWIAQEYDWHALFWLSAVLAAVMTALTAVALPHRANRHPARFDLVGSIGLAVGLVALLVGISKGGDWGWTDGSTLASIIGGAAVLVLWGVYELRHRAPLVDLRTTARLPVLLTNLAALAAGFGMMAQSIVVPQLLQMPEQTGYGLGQTILQAGLWMAPAGLMMLAFAPISSAMLTRIGGRLTLAIGAAVIAGGYLVAAFMTDEAWKLMVASCISAAGVGIGYAAMPTLIMDNVPRSEAGSGVGVNSLMRSMGTTVAGAVMAVVLTSQTMTLAPGTPSIPTHDAFRLCFLIGAGAALVAAALTLFIPRRPRPAPVRDERVESELEAVH